MVPEHVDQADRIPAIGADEAIVFVDLRSRRQGPPLRRDRVQVALQRDFLGQQRLTRLGVFGAFGGEPRRALRRERGGRWNRIYLSYRPPFAEL